ncbi:MAG: DUF4198 domain-containing protein [Croceibacterium sp.]
MAVPAVAHDFWLQPREYALSAPGNAALLMFVGHGQFRDRWGVSNDHVTLFTTIGPNGTVDHRGDLTIGAPPADAVIDLPKPGSYLVLLQSTNSTSQLPAVRFNDYITEEGIAPIIAERTRTGQGKADGREVYSRRTKTLIQVGAVDAGSIARVTHPVNLKLEIVPEKHPLLLARDNRLPVRVYYNGKPLGGAKVKITNLANDATPVATARTGADGRASFVIPSAGHWQMNVIWADVLKGDPRGDFATTFSSLTFATLR